ncbi:undecaprenyldiphospho-muramoylpentapeptide beta-N-acetylglucosaminyltransferase [Sulfuricystis multivorans]|uniref:undecaprenyldiphospho-muramoylpentapeptide beta-N-acetylglucosaminyltransferase n=1 Tax=Sulfuricystis multivorans TaxID=2211108 RepID=UPI000F84AB7E|nr:undecaprenyldiphospho-muramoylpentapeptide beta-N-acetylglucosaminyltransferase [Sulfuricystis multivorans]
MKTIVIMAGGTGGHIMPGLAVADILRDAGWQVVWMGNPDGMEAKLVPPRHYEMAWVKFSALRGKGLARKLLLPFNLLTAFWQAWRAFGRIRPHVVLGLGGFISFPGGMMASLRGIPLVLHEQNAIPGLANRVLAHVADRVLTGFPDTFKRGQWVGNPVRPEITALPPPAERYGARSGRLQVLVLGGSLGAAALNETVPKALASLPEGERPEVVHQSGEKHLDALRAAYAAAGVRAHTVAFIEDMAGAYEWADLVICRAGASTVAELACAGVASILVPFPHAVDDHQTANARFLAQAGAAILLPQGELTPERLALIRDLKRPQLLEMAEKARALAKPAAAEAVAQSCIEVSR